jgi:integrase
MFDRIINLESTVEILQSRSYLARMYQRHAPGAVADHNIRSGGTHEPRGRDRTRNPARAVPRPDRRAAASPDVRAAAWIKHNPFLGIAYGKAFTSPTNRPRPAITEAEPFGQLLRDVAAYSGRRGNLVRKALDLLALTFVRPGTVTQAEWDEFDLDAALWTIPFKKVKQREFRESIKELRGKPHYVPLSRQAVAFLRELKKQTGDGRYLFPGRKGRPISTNALEVALNSLGDQGTHCPHGFRSSASTLLNAERITVDGTELPRFAEQAIDFQLEHVDASVAAIYNRDQRLPERTKMMQFWADKIDALHDSESVVKLAVDHRRA